jgi:hypothetical protein
MNGFAGLLCEALDGGCWRDREADHFPPAGRCKAVADDIETHETPLFLVW